MVNIIIATNEYQSITRFSKCHKCVANVLLGQTDLSHVQLMKFPAESTTLRIACPLLYVLCTIYCQHCLPHIRGASHITCLGT